MHEEKAPAWRTVITVLSLGAYMLAGAWLLRGNEQMFGALVLGLTSLGGVQGFKSWKEHQAKATAKRVPAEPPK